MGSKKKPDADKLRPDVAETAFRTVQEALGERPKTKPPQERTEDEKDPEAVKRGRKGGEKGGKARAASLSAEELSEIGRKGASERWPDEGEDDGS